LVKERTEAGAENKFRARSSGIFYLSSSLTIILTPGRTSGLKLNIDDLLAPLASQSSARQSLKTSAKILASSSSKAKTLSAPLPQRT
jgi:U3 small nucleolar RNA-associated protein 14